MTSHQKQLGLFWEARLVSRLKMNQCHSLRQENKREKTRIVLVDVQNTFLKVHYQFMEKQTTPCKAEMAKQCGIVSALPAPQL